MFKLQIGCLIIVAFISIIYFSTKRLRTYPHVLFSASLLTTEINLLFDIITVYTVNHLATVPGWLNRACHDVFLSSLFLEIFIFYLYCMSLINEKPPTKRKTVCLLLPLATAITCVIALPLGYIETPKTNYSYGPSVIILYLFVFGFIVTALVRMLLHFSEINPKKRNVIITAMVIQFVCLIIQSIFKNLLITSEGLTLLNLACFLTVESPDVLILEQLKEEKERADKANSSKTTFLAQMSHEIRTPINAVLGMNEMILRESTEENIQNYARTSYNAGNTLLSIINDILDISKIEAGKLEITLAEYELHSLISDCYLMTADRAKNKGLEFLIDCDEGLPSKLLGDMFHIRQIIINLLTNAVKYTEKGTVTLTFSGEKTEKGFSLRVSVKDTGIGITEENMKKLFTSFQRFELERNQSVEGTGLGLSISRQLAELMDGKIEVKSVYGQGSEFTCTLPQQLVNEAPLGKLNLLHMAKTTGTGKGTIFTAPDARILVVDDIEMNLIVFSSLLKSSKIQIDTALSGKKCLEMVQQKQYDAIFMDHMMPEMNGIETFRKIKETKHLNSETPVIMLTANAISGEKEKYLSEGFASYLTKPIQSDKLENILLCHLPQEKIKWQEKGTEPATGEAPSKKPNANPSLIDVALGLTYNAGSEDAYRAVLASYVKTGITMLPNLRSYCEAGDWEHYVIEVHALKGISLTIGARQLSEAAKELEFAGKKKEYDLIRSKNAALLELYQAVLAEGGSYLEESGASDATEPPGDSKEMEIDLAALTEYIARITTACLAYDSDGASAICVKAGACSCRGVALKPLFDCVKSFADDFECEEAAAKAQEILEKFNGEKSPLPSSYAQ